MEESLKQRFTFGSALKIGETPLGEQTEEYPRLSGRRITGNTPTERDRQNQKKEKRIRNLLPHVTENHFLLFSTIAYNTRHYIIKVIIS